MAKNYFIEISDGITSITFTMNPELTEIIDAINEAFKTDQTHLRLWDLSAGLDLTNEQLKEIAEYAKIKWHTPSKVALVAPNDLSYGLLRMFEVYRGEEQHKIMVYRSKQEALKWLKEEPE